MKRWPSNHCERNAGRTPRFEATRREAERGAFEAESEPLITELKGIHAELTALRKDMKVRSVAESQP
jgi:hypothetical protein